MPEYNIEAAVGLARGQDIIEIRPGAICYLKRPGKEHADVLTVDDGHLHPDDVIRKSIGRPERTPNSCIPQSGGQEQLWTLQPTIWD